jgi:arsenate reductase
MALTIYHNPRCSKSRKALEIINSRGLEPRIVRYIETPPSAATLEELARLLGLSVADLLRTGEAEYRVATDLPAIDDDTALAGWLAAHPRVLQRPIVVDEDRGRAVLGRPPENVLELL